MTEQIDFWRGGFGDEYTNRNTGDWDAMYKELWGVTRTELNKEFLPGKELRILEVGCNRAHQLLALRTMGYDDLWGLEINKQAIAIARENKELNIVEASAFDIPFKDGFFDLVFTSGVLIHISPDDIPKALREIYRVSGKYIWGFEYFSEKCEEIVYRGHRNRLWKNNFLKLYLDMFPNLQLVRKRRLKYLNEDNVDEMFLLQK